MAEPRIIAVTGIQAAGKSTVARLLAQRFQRGVHIEADLLQGMIVSGAEGVTEPGVITDEAGLQLRLRLRNACLLARSFYEAGFTAIIDDIIIGDRWDDLRQGLDGLPFSLVVLAPRPDVVVQERDSGRGKRALGRDWALHLDQALRERMASAGIWIDSSHQAPEETVDEIMRRLGA